MKIYEDPIDVIRLFSATSFLLNFMYFSLFPFLTHFNGDLYANEAFLAEYLPYKK